MKFIDVTVVQIYLTESDKRLKPLLARLHDEEKVRGVTVFRAITGFGKSGVVHSSSLLDLSLDLPLVLEFFDTPENVERILAHLAPGIEPGHLLCWNARLNNADNT
jgi:PII-like signaling protein